MARSSGRVAAKQRAGLLRIIFRIIRNFLIWMVALICIGLAGAFIWIDHSLQQKFNGYLWDIPVHVYSNPFEIYPGLEATPEKLIQRLGHLGYRATATVSGSGEYARSGASLMLKTRQFSFWDGPQPSRQAQISFANERVKKIVDPQSGAAIQKLRLNPHLLGSLSNVQHEDRIVVRLNEMPELLLATLIAVEDKDFIEHVGIDLRGILRSIWVNLKAGRIVQGGSTLSQQLVKNVYNFTERSYRRKLLEAAMALVLDFRFEKHEILQMYCNEVFLGQDGKRAVHGFGLASQYFFARPVSELSIDEIALLVGMIKAPSAYNPQRNPKRALKRRQVVLQIMRNDGLISESQYQLHQETPIKIAKHKLRSGREFAAFMGTVASQLSKNLDSSLISQGDFSVFTTMDIVVQRAVEKSLATEISAIEKERQIPRGSIEGVVVVVRPDTGEILAMAGGRKSLTGAFNRATQAKRPIGSLVKPLIYLTAFAKDRSHTLATIISDNKLTHRLSDGAKWSPKNYDGEYHGKVTTVEALAKSYNVASVRLGLKTGVSEVAYKLREFSGLSRVPDYPSILLGAIEFSPVEVAQIYQVLANFGYRLDLRTISTITKDAHLDANTFRTDSNQVASRDAVFLTIAAMKEVVSFGTASKLNRQFPARLELAGKTGTTNDYRDSWFAGFSGNYLAVVWLGRDDNKSTGLTGAAGALRVWSSVMQQLDLQPLHTSSDSLVDVAEIDLDSGKLAGSNCRNVLTLPFLRGTMPKSKSRC